MTTVVLPAQSSTAVVRNEADLVRSAGRADREAFDELFRRHVETAWRLAQAVSPDLPSASQAVADGFAHVLRNVRRRRFNADGAFRPALLAEVYRSAMHQARQAKASPGSTTTAPAAPAATPTTATATAFASLPERWRAAVWLADVEHLDGSSLASVLAVSGPVAAQLVERGRQGLTARFAQAGITTPHPLRSQASPMPASLNAVALKRWKTAVAVDPAGRLAPLATWLTQRAPRPLWIASGGLVALGTVGLGVLTVASTAFPGGPTASISVPPPAGGLAVNPSGQGPGGLLLGPGGGASTLFTSAGADAAILTTAVDSTVLPILFPQGPSAPGAASPVLSGAPVAATPKQGSTSTSQAPKTTSPLTQPVLAVPGLATVTQPSSGGTAVSVGTSSTPVLSVTLSPTCTGLQVLNVVTNTCMTPTTTTAPTSPSLFDQVLNTLGL